MLRFALVGLVSFLFFGCNPNFSDLAECYSNIDCGSGQSCNRATNTCVLSSIGNDLDASTPDVSTTLGCRVSAPPSITALASSPTVSLSLTNVGDTTCNYQLALANNGTTDAKLASLNQLGVIAPNENRILVISLNRNNFINQDAVEQTVVISETNNLFSPINLLVQRDLGCNGCKIFSNYGGNCPISARCNGCCNLQQQCITDISSTSCPVGALGSLCVNCGSGHSCQSDPIIGLGYLCTCTSPDIRSEPVSDPDCADIDAVLACSQDVTSGCGGVTRKQCVSCDSGLPAVSQLTLSVQSPKLFRLTWTAALGANSYRILETADASSEPTQVSLDLAATTTQFDLVVPLYARASALYVLQACNNLGCTNSNIVSVGSEIAEAVGHFKASNADSNDLFGSSVALSGDGIYMAVGAPAEASDSISVQGIEDDNMLPEAGAVYIFTKLGNSWIQQAYIKASNNAVGPNADGTTSGDQFGGSVALNFDGSILAVGAVLEDSDNIDNPQDDMAVDSGAVFVYQREATEWTEQAYIKPNHIGPGDNFGKQVALDNVGNRLVVSAPLEDSEALGINPVGGPFDDMAPDSGAIYVFTTDDSNNNWRQESYIKASNTSSLDLFGDSISFSGDGRTLAVASRREDSHAPGVNNTGTVNSEARQSGAVYVFVSQDSGWVQQAFIKASDASEESEFGTSVALSRTGDRLVVGASEASDVGQTYIFSRNAETWTEDSILRPQDLANPSRFGERVAVSADGNIVFVSAIDDSRTFDGILRQHPEVADTELRNSGVVHSYKLVGEQWTLQSLFKPSFPDRNDEFGKALAVSDSADILVVGFPSEDTEARGFVTGALNNRSTQSGAVFLY